MHDPDGQLATLKQMLASQFHTSGDMVAARNHDLGRYVALSGQADQEKSATQEGFSKLMRAGLSVIPEQYQKGLGGALQLHDGLSALAKGVFAMFDREASLAAAEDHKLRAQALEEMLKGQVAGDTPPPEENTPAAHSSTTGRSRSGMQLIRH